MNGRARRSRPPAPIFPLFSHPVDAGLRWRPQIPRGDDPDTARDGPPEWSRWRSGSEGDGRNLVGIEATITRATGGDVISAVVRHEAPEAIDARGFGSARSDIGFDVTLVPAEEVDEVERRLASARSRPDARGTAAPRVSELNASGIDLVPRSASPAQGM